MTYPHDWRLVRALGWALAAATLLMPTDARAYRCLRFGCPAWCAPVEFVLGGTNTDLEAIAPGTSHQVLEQALTDWSRTDCSDLEVRVMSDTALPRPALGDGSSEASFIDEEWPYDPNAIGLTDIEVVGGCIVEADIIFNGENFQWVLGGGGAGVVNAYGVALHESGHALGLGHSDEAVSVMWFLYRGNQPVLEADDIDGICALYPGAGGFDCAQAGCPRGYECQAPTCVRVGAPGCVSHTQCQAGERCDAITGECVIGPPLGEVLGAPCVDDLDCESGLCAQLPSGAVCTEACDGLLPRAVACPDGFICDGDAAGVCGTGLCLAGRPGDASLGAPCEEDSDCSSSMCDGEICATPCDPEISDGCPNGFVCELGAAAGCGACKPPLSAGARCRFTEDCDDALCLVPDGAETGVCAPTCSAADADSCPSGFGCEEVGGMSLCLEEPSRGSLRGGGVCTIGGVRRAPIPLEMLLGVVALVGFCRRRRRRRGNRFEG